MDEYKFISPSTSVKAFTLLPTYLDGFNFKLPTLPPEWGAKEWDKQQKMAAEMSTWIIMILIIIAGSLEAAYSLNWGAQEIWGKGGGETLALLS